ncbi:MAG: endonuclease III [Nitrospirae bacterium]|nr:endonuclease III [Nitrospirota bacterium]
MTGRDKVLEIIKRLKLKYPKAGTSLNFSTPFEILAATILSAQTTDNHVNKITGELFKKYRSIKDFSETSLESLQKDVRSVNFYKTKAKNIQAAATLIIDRFRGNVPKTMKELTILPGVARKTANIVLYNAYGINEGIAVDTHVKRVSFRLGLTKYEDPVKIEMDLMNITEKQEWGHLSHLLIFHGRAVCMAKKPKHNECALYDICPSNGM